MISHCSPKKEQMVFKSVQPFIENKLKVENGADAKIFPVIQLPCIKKSPNVFMAEAV